MHPVLLQIGPLTVYSYGAMLAVSVLVCAWGLSRDAAKIGLSKDAAYDLLFWAAAGGIIGARIFYVALYWEHFMEMPLEVLMLNHGGLAWQGGFAGGVLAGFIWSKRHTLPLSQILDLAAPYVALGQAVGRLGCFFNGCCFGKPWARGIFFPTHNARLHPTQLYEFAGLLLIFVFLKIYAAKLHRQACPPKLNAKAIQRRRGMVFVAYLWLAAIERFAVEFFRADHDGLWWGLSLFQYIAIIIFIASIIAFKKFRKGTP